ncbi:hypothetical protein J3R30DRAFT_3524594 [Lentinula aciculospora]|uniref:C3H1-type domain-containing protein n=1 Tax=Lentinula aciculospora TaxID=153920 RepID=A0A9W9A1K4_9AGAR|nr:hypothetical protein J3R30DRAFT_3524594 [Lentinula aciculospora]
MDSFPNTRPSSPGQNLRIKSCIEQLTGEIQSLLSDNSLHNDYIKKLESDLNVYHRAFSDVNAELAQYKTQMLEADKQKEDLEARLKGHRVVTLIDGDGAIFSKDLIVQGQTGGLLAAQRLSDSIIQHLSEQYGSHQYQLWVYVFLNKKGLMETLGRLGSPSLKNNFEDFVTGFNQAAERFSMLDVGNAKEAADAKIKCHLEDDIRLPQTFKVIFAGCHDNGYVTNLRSQITAGYKNKLILLKSYAEMASGIAEMDLPILAIPDLFVTQKLGVTEIAPRLPSYSSATKVPPPAGEPKETNKQIPVNPQNALLPTSYSAVAAVSYKRFSTPELDSSEGSTSSESDYDDDLPHDAVVAAMASSNSSLNSSRYINPNIPLSKHKPPPCTLFYLATCKHGSSCKYSHDYYLEAEHYEVMRVNAKKQPCPAANRGEVCTWGEECCYGHYCSAFSKCHFLKQGRCKFIGVNMHKDPKSLNISG